MIDPNEKKKKMLERLAEKKRRAMERRGILPVEPHEGVSKQIQVPVSIRTEEPQKPSKEPEEAPATPHRKLSDKDVVAIYEDRNRSMQELADLYNVSRAQISRIKSGERFDHVTKKAKKFQRTDHIKAKSGNYKLTVQQVKNVLESEEPDEIMAKQYGVHPRTIKRIRQGLTYRNKIVR